MEVFRTVQREMHVLTMPLDSCSGDASWFFWICWVDGKSVTHPTYSRSTYWYPPALRDKSNTTGLIAPRYTRYRIHIEHSLVIQASNVAHLTPGALSVPGFQHFEPSNLSVPLSFNSSPQPISFRTSLYPLPGSGPGRIFVLGYGSHRALKRGGKLTYPWDGCHKQYNPKPGTAMTPMALHVLASRTGFLH